MPRIRRRMTDRPATAPPLAANERRPAPGPVLEQRHHFRCRHGECVPDPYAWFQHRDDPAVIAHLERENAFTAQRLAPISALQKQIYTEILERLELDRETVPVRHGPYDYYTRDEEDKSYAIHCRRGIEPGAGEEVILDENVLAQGKAYFSLEIFSLSPDHTKCAYAFDTTGDERLTLFVRNIADDAPIAGPFEGVSAGGAVWANDSETLFFVRLDDRNRPFRIVRYCTQHSDLDEVIVFEEPDEAFRLRLSRSESGAFLFITAWAHDTTEVLYLEADGAGTETHRLCPRRDGIEVYATHHGDFFYLLTNEDAAGTRISRTPVADPGLVTATVFRPAVAGIEITAMRAFAGHLVLFERSAGLPRLRIVDFAEGGSHLVDLSEPVYALYPEDNRQFETTVFRFGYDSLTMPYTVFDYDMAGRHLEQRQQWRIKGYDPAAYRSERLTVISSDGVAVPLSLVYRQDFQRSGEQPILLYGYGAYGICLEAEFSSLRLSLLDRGFACAIAHVRGGGELGQAWHEQGKKSVKQNSFDDFIACAEHLVRERYTRPDRLASMGESAGGLLVAAALNQRPGLFAAAVVDCPFVDVVNTLSDESLPFTVSEWNEWGNPLDPDDYRVMSAYSPFENVARQAYPPMLVMGSFNDPRVPYWEGPKWVARIRAKSTNHADVLVKVRMEAGHQGVSDRFEEVDEWALVYAYLVDRVGGDRPQGG